jgi:hypothetical protein
MVFEPFSQTFSLAAVPRERRPFKFSLHLALRTVPLPTYSHHRPMGILLRRHAEAALPTQEVVDAEETGSDSSLRICSDARLMRPLPYLSVLDWQSPWMDDTAPTGSSSHGPNVSPPCGTCKGESCRATKRGMAVVAGPGDGDCQPFRRLQRVWARHSRCRMRIGLAGFAQLLAASGVPDDLNLA